MKALAITDHGDTEYIDLPCADPEHAIRELVGSALDATALPGLADHLDMWTAFEPLITVAGVFHNDVASQIITAGIGRPRQVFGTAVITAHTHSGILAALAPTDIVAFDQIIAEIYTGAHFRHHQAG